MKSNLHLQRLFIGDLGTNTAEMHRMLVGLVNGRAHMDANVYDYACACPFMEQIIQWVDFTYRWLCFRDGCFLCEEKKSYLAVVQSGSNEALFQSVPCWDRVSGNMFCSPSFTSTSGACSVNQAGTVCFSLAGCLSSSSSLPSAFVLISFVSLSHRGPQWHISDPRQ